MPAPPAAAPAAEDDADNAARAIANAASPGGSRQRRWRRVLYERNAYPDNYTDRSFLASMVTNADVKPYNYWELVESTTVVTQQVSAVFCYVAIFFMYLDEELETSEVMLLEAALLAGGAALWLAADARARASGGGGPLQRDVLRVIGRQLLLAFVLYELSPVLRTLTVTFSDDTIWALTICVLLAHLLLHDYSSGPAHHALVSMNAGMFAAVLLASRLPSDTHVFAITSLSLPLLVFLPLLRRHLRAHWRLPHLLLTAGIAAAAAAVWCGLSLFVTALCVAMQLGVTFACPAALVALQRHKRCPAPPPLPAASTPGRSIRGPWDEASPPLD